MDVEQFKRILLERCKLDVGRPVVAGISGGPDSLCMLDLLIRSGMEVIVVHLNHQLRPEADQEAQMVERFCLEHGLQCIIGKKDIPSFAHANKLSLEEAARNLRYSYLFAQAHQWNAQSVLVAHNADDQAETVLMHLIRGSGLSGLKGMQIRSIQPQWSDEIPLIRPLLQTSRVEILNYCNDHHLTPSFDLSNNDTKYLRNRVRHDLLPDLETYNPQIKQRLTSMAEVVGSEDDFLIQQVDETLRGITTNKGDRFIIYSRMKLLGLHPALLQRILRQTIHQIDPTLRDIDFGMINRAKRFLYQNGKVNHLQLAADIEIIKEGHESVIFCDQRDPLTDLWPQLMSNSPMEIALAGITVLGGGWQLTCMKTERTSIFTHDPMSCTLDAQKIDTLHLSIFHPGVRFSPFNLKGKSIKLSDFWTNQGLPERARTRWPLVKTSDGEIIWVPGFQIAHEVRVTPETCEVLNMTISKNDQSGNFSPAN